MNFRLPTSKDRTTIVGPTGSGKTRFGMWLNSFADFKSRPHIAVDFKGEELFKQIERIRPVGFEVPKHPGFYVVRPIPGDEDRLEKWLWQIWARHKIGLFFDEGAMVDARSKAFKAILTQGRSLRISVMALTQRPVECSRYLFSEADFISMFPLYDKRDNETVRGLVPNNEVWDFSRPLPEYTSRWYDRKQRFSCIVKPVPDDDTILSFYEDALRVKTRWS